MVVSQNILHVSSSSTPSGWCSHHFPLLFKPFLQQSFQWASLAIMSSLVLFLRQTVILANYMIYRFTLLATQPTKRGVHGLVYVELYTVFCQCLFLGGKNQCFTFQLSPVSSSLLLLLFLLLSNYYYYYYYYYASRNVCKLHWPSLRHSKILFLDFLLHYLLAVC